MTGKEAACREIAERNYLTQVCDCKICSNSETERRALAAIRESYDAGAKPWRDAIEDRLSVLHLSMSNDPKLALDNLIGWEVKVALDPKVSEEARKLKDAGAKAQREQWASIFDVCAESTIPERRKAFQEAAAAIRQGRQ